MNVKIQSIHFDATEKLQEFIEKKVAKLEKTFEDISSAEVQLKVVKPATAQNKETISEVSPSHADISGLRCGARIRSRMQEHIRYMSIPSIPSMYSFRLMHGTSGTMTRGRTYVWCVIPMLRRRVCCSTAGW